jgi:5-methylcytosine-specific restriction protein A
MPLYPTRFCSCRPSCPNRISRGQRFCQEGQQVRDAARLNAALRRLYHTERWRQRRRAQLDAFPACEDCAAVGKLEPATDAHHRQKPKTEAEFFSIPLGSLCHRCHSVRTQRGE